MSRLGSLVRQLQDTHIAETAAAIARVTEAPGQVQFWVEAMVGSIQGGGTILACGNGGSAAEAQHLVGELVGRFRRERAPISAIALGSEFPTLSAIANDYDYGKAFSRQAEALGRRGDVLVGISTSGNSRSVLEAMRVARARGVVTVGLTGKIPGGLRDVSDLLVQASSTETSTIQEVHLFLIHLVCNIIETYLFDDGYQADRELMRKEVP